MLFLLLGLVFSTEVRGFCFPEEERVNIDPALSVLELQHFVYPESLIVSTIAKILLNEKVGVAVNFNEVDYDFDTYANLELLNNNKHQVCLGIYDNYDVIKFPNLLNVGYSGYIEQSGWYVPNYLVQSSPSTLTYLGYKELYENSNLFCTGENDFDDYKNFQSKTNDLLNGECAVTTGMTVEEATACLTKIDGYDNFPRKCPIAAFGSPDNPEWGFNRPILTKLHLQEYINMTYADEEGDIIVEEQLFNFAKAHYDARQPFLSHLYEPSSSLASNAGMNITRVTLPPFDNHCKDIYYYWENIDEYNCDYKVETLLKVINSALETENPMAFRFFSQFSITGNEDLNNMLFDAATEGKSVEEVACQYLQNNPESWTASIPEKDQLVEKKISKGSRISMMVLGVIFCLYGLLNAVLVIVYRKNLNIKTSSVTFLFLISVGSFLAYLYVVFLSLEPSTGTCVAAYSLEIIGYFVVMVALIFKTLRVSVLFKMSRPSKSQRIAVKHLSDKYLLTYYVIIMILITIFVVLYMTLGTPEPITDILSVTNTGLYIATEYIIVCDAPIQGFAITFVVFQLVLVFLGMFLAISIRNTPSVFNESAHIGAAMYNLFMCLIVKLVLTYLTEASYEVKFLVNAIFTLVPITLIVFLVVTKKFYYIIRGWVPDLSKLFKGTSSNSSKMNKSHAGATHRSRSRANSRAQKQTSGISELKIINEDGTSKIIVMEGPSLNEAENFNDTVDTLVYDGQ